MADLTVVTCFARCAVGDRSFEEAAQLLQPLIDADVPLVVYVDEEWKGRLEARCSRDRVRLQDSSPRRRLAGISGARHLEVAWSASTHADRPPIDSFAVALTKMGMLHDQSIWNPFGTGHLVWIDAAASTSFHPGYLTDIKLLEILPALLRGFLLLSRPSPVIDAAGAPDASRVQSQLFGGELAAIAEVNAMYYQLLEALIREGTLPTEEAIFSLLLERSPERFERFVLQENGLLGFLFEEMRSGRVLLERTRVH